MARLGTTTARWQMRRDGMQRDIALRSDGVLLEKCTWLKEDGHVDFGDGWKIKSRHPKPLDFIREWMARNGYTEL